MATTGLRLLALWRRLSSVPGGRRLFAMLLRKTVPYSASVRPRILVLEPGHVRIAIADRASLRNHLSSIHAIALANVGELASGLAMTTALPGHVRGIVVRLTIDYIKKARGTVIADSVVRVPDVTAEMDFEVVADIRDDDGDVVARATVTWRLAPSRA